MDHSTNNDSTITLFARFDVGDVAEFRQVHREAVVEQRKYGVSEKLYQSLDNAAAMTVVLEGSNNSIDKWLASPERARLAARLKLKSDGES